MGPDSRVTRFTEALNVMNSALAENKNSTPYKQILSAAEKLMDDKKLGIAVYESDPSSPFDYFTVRFRNGSLELVSHGKQDPDIAWKVSQDYLEKVRSNPDEYIQHPAKLDWHWLKDRLGMG